MHKISAAMILFFFSQAVWAISCETQISNICSEGTCKQLPNAGRSWIELEGSSLKRCDTRGCDEYEAFATRSGIFHNISIGNRGYILKIDEHSNFIEVATAGLSAIIKSGSCR